MQKSDDSFVLEGSKESTHVNFVCQHCFQPMKLDPSLYSLDDDIRKEFEAGINPSEITPEVCLDLELLTGILSDTEIVSKVIPPAKTSASNGSEFTLIEGMGTESVNPHNVQISAKLFDLMSGNSSVDHPLCEECTDKLLNTLDDSLQVEERELENYKELLSSLELRDVYDDTELDEELDNLRLEEQSLVAELAKVEEEYDDIMKQRVEMNKINKMIDKEEEAYWREYCDNQKGTLELEDNQASVHNYLNYTQTQLEKLQKTNVFNSTFHIWHKGHFGTINNFRLGRLPSVPVEWIEINAAWGQTVLLLHSLAKKISLVFQRYRLVPYGNHSFIECLEDKSKQLPLYGSGGFRFFWDTKFDHAMVAFLDCLQQFKEEVEKGDSKFNLPYKMEKGRIYDSSGSGAYSVKIQFNSEEHWTKALKFMLTNLKWGLAWVSSQFADKHS